MDDERRIDLDDFEAYVQELIDAHGHAQSTTDFLNLCAVHAPADRYAEIAEAARRLFSEK